MSTRVDNLINDIKNAMDPSIDDLEEIRVIIGNDDYTLQSGIKNTVATGITIYGSFQNVAFLCDTKNLNLVSIIALLLESWDDAIDLIDRILDKHHTSMNQLAIFLATKRIILVNRHNNYELIENFLSKHTTHKVLFVGADEASKYNSITTKSIWIPHCSGETYGKKPAECYATYFDPSYNCHSKSNISIADFRL